MSAFDSLVVLERTRRVALAAERWTKAAEVMREHLENLAAKTGVEMAVVDAYLGADHS